MSVEPQRSTKEAILQAAVRLVARNGTGAATMRAVAREVGVTEAALYRHYASKEDLWIRAYTRIVGEMADEKRHLLDARLSIREQLREWIRLTYAYYDRHPEGFTYVLLATHVVPDADDLLAVQGALFRQMVARAMEAGRLRPMAVDLVYSHFTGVVLNVPRLINEGQLEGPAGRYVDEVAGAVWRMVAPDGAATD